MIIKKNKSKQSKTAANKSSASNYLLNTFIFLLGIVIIYMIYSIISKVSPNRGEEDITEFRQAPSEIIQLEVLNGCGVSGVADEFTSYLRSNKFDVVNVSNYSSYDVTKSLVIDRIGNRANAQKVAESLGIDKENIVQQINEDYFLDVSLVIGRDFNKLTPYK